MSPNSDPPAVSEAPYQTVPGEAKYRMVPGKVDPRLIKAQIQSLQSVMRDFDQDFEKAMLKIKDRNTRRALISLKLATDMTYALLIIALSPYLRELDERIAEQEKEADASEIPESHPQA